MYNRMTLSWSTQRALTIGGKYHSTAGLQFDWIDFSSFSTYKCQYILLFDQIESSSAQDQPYSETYPYGKCPRGRPTLSQ